MFIEELIQIMKATGQYLPVVPFCTDFKLTYFLKDKCANGIVGIGLCFVVGHSDVKISLSFVWPILVALCLQEDGKIQ